MGYTTDTERTVTALEKFHKLFDGFLDGAKEITINDTHGKLEQLIADNVDKLTDEHWKFITDSENSLLFVDGVAHISWNTDRHIILRAVLKDKEHYEPLAKDVYDSTWYEHSVAWLKTKTGLIIKCEIETPRVSASNCHYSIGICNPEEVPVKTHTAVIFGVNNYGKAYIICQYTGTLEGCEDWIRDNMKKDDYCFFRIIELKKN